MAYTRAQRTTFLSLRTIGLLASLVAHALSLYLSFAYVSVSVMSMFGVSNTLPLSKAHNR
jgi:hypothetical protein